MIDRYKPPAPPSSAEVLAKLAQNVAALVAMTEHAVLPAPHREVAAQASEILRWVRFPGDPKPFCFDTFQDSAAYLLSDRYWRERFRLESEMGRLR